MMPTCKYLKMKFQETHCICDIKYSDNCDKTRGKFYVTDRCWRVKNTCAEPPQPGVSC